MAGMRGQQTTKATEMPSQYEPGWIAKLDQRYTLGRAIKARLKASMTDLGGPESLSYQQRALCQRVVFMEGVLESHEAAFIRGRKIDTSSYVATINSLVGLLKALGLKRVAREATLQDVLRKDQQ